MTEKLEMKTLLNEIKQIRVELRKVSAIIESRFVGVEEPSREEVKAIEEFEVKRKKRKLELILVRRSEILKIH